MQTKTKEINTIVGACPLCGAPYKISPLGASFGCLCMASEFLIQVQDDEQDDSDDYDD